MHLAYGFVAGSLSIARDAWQLVLVYYIVIYWV